MPSVVVALTLTATSVCLTNIVFVYQTFSAPSCFLIKLEVQLLFLVRL